MTGRNSETYRRRWRDATFAACLILAVTGSRAAAADDEQQVPVQPPVAAPATSSADFLFGAPRAWIAIRGSILFPRAGGDLFTFVNDQLICEYAEPDKAYRPDDKPGRLLGSGTFALQAHDPGSVVKYRNIRVLILPDNAAPPAGLVPIADRELDQLITQASNDNIPLIDLSLNVPHDADDEWRAVRRYGFSPLNLFPRQAVDDPPPALMFISDGAQGPDVAALKAAKAAGVKVAFSSSGTSALDEAHIKRRLKAIYEAGLGWKDFWVPGKP